MVLYGIPYYFLCCIVCVPWHCLYGMVLRGMKWTSLQSRKHHSCLSLSALCQWWGCLSQESIHAPSSPSMGKTFLLLPFQPSCQFPNLTIWYQPRQYQHRCRSAWCRPMQEKSRPDPYGQSGKAAQRDSERRYFFYLIIMISCHLSWVVVVKSILARWIGAGNRDATKAANSTNSVWGKTRMTGMMRMVAVLLMINIISNEHHGSCQRRADVNQLNPTASVWQQLSREASSQEAVWLVKQKSFTLFSESTYSKVPAGVIAMVEKDGIKAFSFSGIKRVKWALSS